MTTHDDDEDDDGEDGAPRAAATAAPIATTALGENVDIFSAAASITVRKKTIKTVLNTEAEAFQIVPVDDAGQELGFYYFRLHTSVFLGIDATEEELKKVIIYR
jgi:hypothetical protein